MIGQSNARIFTLVGLIMSCFDLYNNMIGRFDLYDNMIGRFGLSDWPVVDDQTKLVV